MSADSLDPGLAGLGIDLHMADNCLPPRTAEEAVPEDVKAGCAV